MWMIGALQLTHPILPPGGTSIFDGILTPSVFTWIRREPRCSAPCEAKGKGIVVEKTDHKNEFSHSKGPYLKMKSILCSIPVSSSKGSNAKPRISMFIPHLNFNSVGLCAPPPPLNISQILGNMFCICWHWFEREGGGEKKSNFTKNNGHPSLPGWIKEVCNIQWFQYCF